ncbi:hypothetical protein BJX70DRAFT_401534 [Aspergillus crustosus]
MSTSTPNQQNVQGEVCIQMDQQPKYPKTCVSRSSTLPPPPEYTEIEAQPPAYPSQACNTTQSSSVQTHTQTPLPYTTPAAPNPPRKRKSCLLLFWTLIIIVVLGACIGGPLGAILPQKAQKHEEQHGPKNETQPLPEVKEAPTASLTETQPTVTYYEVPPAATVTETEVQYVVVEKDKPKKDWFSRLWDYLFG